MKRLFDVVIATAGLITLLPVFVISAIAVLTSSPGGIFFKQERVGLNGRTFEILKFRTMRVAITGLEPQITIGNDPRVTHIGRLLRKTKLDELPQLWNVFVGEMSLVGPRPEVPKYVATYTPAMHALILSVRPGITDPCSLYFRDESKILAEVPDPERYYVETLLPEKIRVSGEYIKRRSFYGDVHVIVQTILSMFRS